MHRKSFWGFRLHSSISGIPLSSWAGQLIDGELLINHSHIGEERSGAKNTPKVGPRGLFLLLSLGVCSDAPSLVHKQQYKRSRALALCIQRAFAHLIQSSFEISAATSQSAESATDWPPQTRHSSYWPCLSGQWCKGCAGSDQSAADSADWPVAPKRKRLIFFLNLGLPLDAWDKGEFTLRKEKKIQKNFCSIFNYARLHVTFLFQHNRV